MSKLKSESIVSGVGIRRAEFLRSGVGGDFEIKFKPDGVVDELRIVGDEFARNGLELICMDGSVSGDFGELDRLRDGRIRLVIGFKNDDDDDDGAAVVCGSVETLWRVGRDNVDMKRLAAAIGPIDKRSVNELVRVSFAFVCSFFDDVSSLFDMLNKHSYSRIYLFILMCKQI